MALRLSLSLTAQNDIANTADFLSNESSQAALKFIERLEEVAELLCQKPHIGQYVLQPPRTGLRKMSVPPYIAFYRATETEVILVRVLHSARDIRLEDLRP